MAGVAKQMFKLLNRGALNSLNNNYRSFSTKNNWLSQISNANLRCKWSKYSMVSAIGNRFAHTEAETGDKELIGYLADEIKAEAENVPQKIPDVPGFDVKCNGAELIFMKKFGNENIQVSLNINNSVQPEWDDMAESRDDAPQMVCKPQFQVEVSKGSDTLSFSCTFSDDTDKSDEDMDMGDDDGDQPPQGGKGRAGGEPPEDASAPDDVFNIDEVCVYSGEQPDSTIYSVYGEVMDGEMYDRLMDYLADRGVDNTFAQSLVYHSTIYDTRQYISTLEGIRAFIAK